MSGNKKRDKEERERRDGLGFPNPNLSFISGFSKSNSRLLGGWMEDVFCHLLLFFSSFSILLDNCLFTLFILDGKKGYIRSTSESAT
jgi:hypothetical protein